MAKRYIIGHHRFLAQLKANNSFCDITKMFAADTMTELKRKASYMANGNFNAIDELLVREYNTDTKEQVREFNMTRINKKYPNNTIKRGVWH